MFGQPIVCGFLLALTASAIGTVTAKAPFSDFVLRFLNFPYWPLLSLFISFWIIRAVKASFVYRWLHTVQHRVHVPSPYSQSGPFSSRLDSVGNSPVELRQRTGDITSASPLDSPGHRLPFHRNDNGGY